MILKCIISLSNLFLFDYSFANKILKFSLLGALIEFPFFYFPLLKIFKFLKKKTQKYLQSSEGYKRGEGGGVRSTPATNL